MPEASSTSVAVAKLREWRADPGLFVRQVFKVIPDEWQDYALGQFLRGDRLAMQACVGPGKTAFLAWVCWYWLLLYPYSKTACVSITNENLRDNLWAELAKWRRRSRILEDSFTWTKTRIFYNDAPEEWWCSARSWSRSADPGQMGQTLAGLHAEYTMAVLDESGGIPSAVAASAKGVLAAGKLGKIVQAGNPTHLSGALHDAATKERDRWRVVRVTGDPDDPKRAPRVDATWAREMIEDYGRSSAIVCARVLGQFPRKSDNALIGLDDWENAVSLSTEGLDEKPRYLGVDVARFGDDTTFVAGRYGAYLKKRGSWKGNDIVESSTKVAEIALRDKVQEIRVDDVGVGGGLTDNLRHNKLLRQAGIKVLGVNAGARAEKTGEKDRPMYANMRAQMALDVRSLFRDCKIKVESSLAESALCAQLTDIRIGFDASGKVFKLEAKESYKKRNMGRSPDEYDAVALACADLKKSGHHGLFSFLQAQIKESAEREQKEKEAQVA